jgi:hypothetical protein
MEEKEITETESQETKDSEEPMINLEDLLGLTDDDTAETIAVKVQEKMGVSLNLMRERLSQVLVDKAEEFTLELPNIAPLGDYGKLLEDNDQMALFLKEEANKSEYWKLYGLKASDVKKDLVSFIFVNMAVDDGDVFKGFVFLSKTGKIKHVFVQVEE